MANWNVEKKLTRIKNYLLGIFENINLPMSGSTSYGEGSTRKGKYLFTSEKNVKKLVSVL